MIEIGLVQDTEAAVVKPTEVESANLRAHDAG
jgi:hypothetical protein